MRRGRGDGGWWWATLFAAIASGCLITGMHQVQLRERAEQDLQVVAGEARALQRTLDEQALTIDVLRRQVADGAGSHAEAQRRGEAERTAPQARNP
jgi:hypothetical protein